MTETARKDANPVYRIIAVRTAQASLAALGAHVLLHWPLTGPHALGLFLSPLLCVYFLFVFVGRWNWGLPILTRLPRIALGEKTVALTFDDGPSPETTPAVLDALRAFGVPATFFVLGEAAERSPDLLRRIAAEGHCLGLHGYSHDPFVLMGPSRIESEIAHAREAVRRACPNSILSPWLRPPHGFKSPVVLWAAHRAGCRLAGWSGDGRDYVEQSPERVAANVLDHLRPGQIILLHDGRVNSRTPAALLLILHGLADRGWKAIHLPSTPKETP